MKKKIAHANRSRKNAKSSNTHKKENRLYNKTNKPQNSTLYNDKGINQDGLKYL